MTIFAVCLAAPKVAIPSGSYIPQMPQPPASVIEHSRKYEMGKVIFAGKEFLKEQTSIDRPAQRIRLLELQDQLPPRLKNTVNLPSLAGRLTREQMADLEYFLKIRLKID